MKKIVKLVAISFAILAVTACAEESKETPVSFSKELTFAAIREGLSPESKSVRMEDGSTWWNASEVISVFYGSGSAGGSKFTTQNNTLQDVVEFSGSVQMSGSGKDFWAVYPYSEENECDGSSITTVIPAVQTASEGNFSGDVFPAVAKTKTTEFAFWNICGGIKFFVSRSDIQSVIFKGNNNEPIAGKVKVSFGTNGIPVVQEVIDAKTEVTIIAPEGGAFKPGKYYYITLLPCQLSKGFTMTFKTNEDSGILSSDNAQTIKRATFGVIKNADSKVSEWIKDLRDIVITLRDNTKASYSGIEIIDGLVVNVNGQSYTTRLFENNTYGVTVPTSDYYVCGYPDNSIEITQDGKYATLRHPQVISGNADYAYMGTTADSPNPSIALQPVTAVLNMAITGQKADQWNKIIISSTGSALSGTAGINLNDLSIETIIESVSSVIIQRDRSSDYENDIIIPLFPQDLNDLKAVIYDKDGKALAIKNGKSPLHIRASSLYRTTIDLDAENPGSGTLEDPFTVAGAIEYTKSLGSDVISDDKVYIKGKVSRLECAFKTSGIYGNATFYISDDGAAADEFYCYQVAYLGNNRYISGDDVEVGDDVIICGKVVNYRGNSSETVQGNAFLYSLNGKTDDIPVEITACTIAEFIQKAESNTYYRLTGKVYSFEKGTNSLGHDWMQFNLNDGTATILVYGFKNGQYDAWADKIKDGGTVVITGTYEFYSNKSQHEVMNTTVESYSVGISGKDTATPQWLELPATKAGDGRTFYVHDMQGGEYIDARTSGIRNWSFYWDSAEHLSQWVAYPLNRSLRGTGSRSNAWGLDPLLPAEAQPNLSMGSYGGGWTCGHQIPSADRLTYAANVSTFYGTNMTPQEYNFNGGIWASLEDRVRGYASTADTLYVVTGCLYKDSSTYTGDRSGFSIKVPTHYFKALLFKGISTYVSAEDYMAAGFLLPHDSEIAEDNCTNYIMSIDELEKQTGIDFFPNLVSVVGSAAAESIEAQKPADWWK